MSVWEVLNRNVFLLLPCYVLMTFLHLWVVAHIAHWEKELWSHQMHLEQQQSMIHGLSTHGFGAGPHSEEELKANSMTGLQPTKGLKAPRGSVSQHSSAYVGWKGSGDLNHSCFSWRLTTEEKHALAIIATSCCNEGAADVISNHTHTYSLL